MADRKTLDLADALPFLGTDRGMFNHWLDKGVFQTKFLGTTPGVARQLTLENCLEVAFFVAAFAAFSSVKHPATIAAASATSRHWLNMHKKGKLGEVWVHTPPADLPNGGFVDAAMKISDLVDLAAYELSGPSDPDGEPRRRRPVSFQIVHVGLIVRSLKSAFADGAADG